MNRNVAKLLALIILLQACGYTWVPLRQDDGETVKQLCYKDACCQSLKGSQKLKDNQSGLFGFTCRNIASFQDPVRRTHVLVKSGRLSLVVGSTVLLYKYTGWWFLWVPALLDFVVYEFILEPWSKARVKQGKPSLQGNYWETGPQTGEVFVIP